jgi:hypothetical protein
MMKIKKYLFLTFATFALVFVACNKEEESPDQNPTVKISITDAPGDYKNIYLHVDEVEIRNGGEWINFTLTQTDTFDILDYTNGNMLLLAEGQVSAATTDEIRLVLSDGNTLVLEDGSVHDLKVPSGSSSGLKIKLDVAKDLQSNQTYYAVLDFDAEKSIVKKGNGDYSLKPVIRGYWEEGKGSLEGYVISTGFQASVNAINGSDSVGSAIADVDGYYLIGGLPQATYDLSMSSTNGKTATATGISVTQNNVTVVDSVDLN